MTKPTWTATPCLTSRHIRVRFIQICAHVDARGGEAYHGKTRIRPTSTSTPPPQLSKIAASPCVRPSFLSSLTPPHSLLTDARFSGGPVEGAEGEQGDRDVHRGLVRGGNARPNSRSRKRWQEARKAAGKDHYRPNIVFGSNARVVLEKFVSQEHADATVGKIQNTQYALIWAYQLASDHQLWNSFCLEILPYTGASWQKYWRPLEQHSSSLEELILRSARLLPSPKGQAED
ncbi:hypothetical protein B0H14DRAFT_2560373 [Mycena olivaceomarginata]|nr:hypothetical protein B0H14DRAFT_2560373 [Mycena olivaceomarginata]